MGGGGGGGNPGPFLKIEQNCPDFGQKGPNCVHSWVESSTENVGLRVPRGKSSKMFPWGISFPLLLTKVLRKPPLP